MKNYYSSKHWKQFRDKYLKDFNVVCSVCHRRRWTLYKINTKKHKKGDSKRLLNFNIHHLNYDNLYNETSKDVIPLCKFCHDLCHTLERAAKMNNNVYGKVYDLLVSTTDWDYKRRK